ncbi:formate dehydrogenase accessory sulfurtransferase FdhD [Nocardioides insulae]|uniref:formate dehydrogenase accessory sulfurtransferase FdhD n=1 Tax=Nocardioides insulae TaxID=394734 RepID=UPI001FE2149A|nr:formate dehydrogenase accessory sulfurtransferase FdhD [Nocardioides insulae]
MTTRRAIVRRGRPRGDDLAVEDPLVLGLEGPGVAPGGEVLATVMRTPGHDLELAAGWLCVETAGDPDARGVRRPEDLVSLRACRDHDTDRVLARLREGVRAPRARAFVTSSACGVCSADVVDLSGLRTSHARRDGWQVTGEVLAGLPGTLRAQQRVFARTGGLHAAGLATAEGAIDRVFEDVGRHNAVDKAVGRALLDGALPASDRLLVVSGRVSFELVQKAMAAGVVGLVAVSAPSSLAVDLAREHGLLLAGMVRDDGFNLYAGEELVR